MDNFVAEVLLDLEAVAVLLDNTLDAEAGLAPVGIPVHAGWACYTKQGPAIKWSLRMKPTAEAVRARAESLKKAANWSDRARRGYKPPKPHTFKTTRPKRSSPVAQRFLDDNEKDNWREYDALYR